MHRLQTHYKTDRKQLFLPFVQLLYQIFESKFHVNIKYKVKKSHQILNKIGLDRSELFKKCTNIYIIVLLYSSTNVVKFISLMWNSVLIFRFSLISLEEVNCYFLLYNFEFVLINNVDRKIVSFMDTYTTLHY